MWSAPLRQPEIPRQPAYDLTEVLAVSVESRGRLHSSVWRCHRRGTVGLARSATVGRLNAPLAPHPHSGARAGWRHLHQQVPFPLASPPPFALSFPRQPLGGARSPIENRVHAATR